MTCETCGEKPKKCGNCNKDFPRAVIEINNPEKIVLFRKVVVPASMGGRDALPPAIGKYHNVLLEYEADGSLFLYSSDGIPTQLSTDVTDLQKQLDALGIEVDNERVERVAADEELSDTIEEEITNRKDADTALGSQITNLDNSLATVAKTGSYNDLSNKPTIGNATLTIKKNGSNVGTFTANATANKSIDISVPTKTSNLVNDGSDGASQYVESDDLATVATSGSYNDLTNKPTIGNATLTIKRNNTSAGTFTANATTNKSINIAVPTKTSDLTNDGADGTSTYVETRNLPTVGNATLTITENNTSVGTFTANATSNKTINITSPTKTSDLTNDGADGTSTYVEADDLPTVDTTYSSSSNNAIANSTVTNSLDRNVMTNLAVDSTPSTTTVNLNNTKTNLAYPSSSTTSSISLPVASSTQAGVMNSATFDAVTSNTNNINAILNGAVAISNLPASPTQAQLTTAWKNETGLTSIINRASVYDVTNNKVWTYYTNDQTWHAASNTSQVTVNTFTNSSEGTIKGSTNDGQVFAESDGTGSVNGWDTLTGNVANNTSKLATIAQGAEVNVQANWTQTNTSADDYIKNKPANLVQDANYVHTDNNFTTALKDKLNGISAGAEVNVQSDWSQTDTSADDYIKNKPANLVQDANYVHTDNNFTTTLKNKLDGIESGAEANVQADWSQTDTSADDYIKNKPTIPTVNNATLTIQKNGTNVQTFTANSSTNKTANITVPTAVSELTNDAGYATTTQLNNGLATKQDTLTAGDNIQINGNTISATDTTYTAGNAIDITNGEISADIHPADFFTAEDVISDCGSDLSLDGTIASTLKSVELKGDTYQQTYSGKNLLRNTFNSPSTVSGVTFTKNPDGTITANGTATAGINFYPNGNVFYPISEGTYTLSDGLSNPTSNTYFTYIDTNTSSPNYLYFNTAEGTVTRTLSEGITIKPRIVIRQGQTLDNVVFKLMLEQGSTATAFEPYVGGIPAPNPDYPQDVQVVTGEQTVEVTGKNIVNLQGYSSSGVTSSINGDGSITISGTATSSGGVLVMRSQRPMKAGTYTMTISRPLPFLINFSVASGVSFRIPAGGTSVTTTLSEDHIDQSGLYMAMTAGTTYNETFNLQIVAGSTPDYGFEPYHLQSYTVDLGPIELCKIGDYQDYIYKSGDDWYVHKEMGKITLDGSETWTAAQMTNNWLYYTINAGMTTVTSSQVPKIVSNYFSVTTTDGQWTSVAGSKSVTLNNTASPNTQIRFTVGDSTNKLADFKTWLSTHSTTVYYALATPTNILIENPGLVAQLNALAEAKSYNDQTNIVVTAAGENLPAILCVEAYRKSLSGVIEAIDNACTCRKNLVVYLPNGMTTYENDDAPIPIPEVVEALKRGQSVFLVDDALPENIYVVTAASADDGIWTMRADQTGIDSDVSDGHWHISGRDNLWRRVEFVPDTEQDSVVNLSVVFDDSSWDTPVSDYSVTNIGGGTTTVGSCNLSAAQGNAGLFVNDDTGEFVTVGEAYELIASGVKVKFNNVPVGQHLTSPHTYSLSGEDVYSGIELPVKYFINVDGAYITDYTNSIAQLRNKGVPPLEVSIRKIDQGDILDYEFTIQGIMPSYN